MQPYSQYPIYMQAKLAKGDRFLIKGPFADVDLATSDFGLNKCGVVECSAYLQDRVSEPIWMHLTNNKYNSADGTYNTELIIKPLEGRDSVGSYDVFIDC